MFIVTKVKIHDKPTVYLESKVDLVTIWVNLMKIGQISSTKLRMKGKYSKSKGFKIITTSSTETTEMSKSIGCNNKLNRVLNLKVKTICKFS